MLKYYIIFYFFFKLHLMSTQILSSHQLAKKIQEETKQQITNLKIDPCLVVILIGNHPASEIYVNHKKTACNKVGINCHIETYADSISEHELIAILKKHNNNQAVNGIIVQFPLPAHINPDNIVEYIAIDKDVDGFHPYNLGKLAVGNPGLRPCTSFGIIQLLDYYHIPLQGIDALVIGTSRIVGRPMALELLLKKATVTVAHSKTTELNKKIQANKLIIVATGNRNVVTPDTLLPHHIIIDVGIHRIEQKLTGDVCFNQASTIVEAITPVPGGVGPMTISALLQNIVKAYKIQHYLL